MKSLLPLGIAIAAIGAAPAFANIDPKIAEFCLKAQDFQGCVKSMSGDSSGSTTTIRQIQQKGADLAEGNQCPAGFAYIGGGNCQEVKCRSGTGYGHDYRLAGKGWSCQKTLGMFGNELYLDGNQIVRASVSSQCPTEEPVVGFNSSCNTARSTRWVEQDQDWTINSGNDNCFFNSDCSFDKWRKRKGER